MQFRNVLVPVWCSDSHIIRNILNHSQPGVIKIKITIIQSTMQQSFLHTTRTDRYGSIQCKTHIARR